MSLSRLELACENGFLNRCSVVAVSEPFIMNFNP